MGAYIFMFSSNTTYMSRVAHASRQGRKRYEVWLLVDYCDLLNNDIGDEEKERKGETKRGEGYRKVPLQFFS